MSTTAQLAAGTPGGRGTRGSAFFFWLAVVCTVLVFAGFGLNRIVNWEEFDRFTIWIALHGLFSAAWYLVLINQIRLVRNRGLATHRRLGRLSVWLVLAILISGVMMTVGLYEHLLSTGELNLAEAEDRVNVGQLFGGTLIQWVLFAALYGLGIANLRRPIHHKRFMVASAIQMMPAGLSRLVGLVGMPGVSALLIMLALYLSILVYDWRTDRRLHWSTLVSLGLFLVLPICFFTVFQSQAWGDWVTGLVAG